jgi:hypothetical protein
MADDPTARKPSDDRMKALAKVRLRSARLASRIGADAQPIEVPGTCITYRETEVIEAGCQYGYPDCCIVFFVRCWLVWSLRNTREPLDRYTAMLKRLGQDPDGYLPCPHCALANAS